MRVDKHLIELSLAASALVHTGAVAVLPQSSPARPSASAPVEFVTLPRPPEPEVEDPPPEPLPEPVAPPPAKRAAPKPPAPEPAPAPPAPTTAEPAELSGKTLTAEGPGPSFAAPVGDGSARGEPVQSGSRPAPTPAPRAPAPAPTKPPPPPAPSTLPLESLARRPEPPALAGVLARHYPEEARRRGVGGQAVVRARVDADGKVRTASVASESEPGFGAACQRTLIGSRWSPPVDREGKPVGTWVRYTCRFRVGL